MKIQDAITDLRQLHPRCALLSLIAILALSSFASATETAPGQITLAQSVLTLNGPWKFRTGDDAAWADPKFDDSAWESVDLTAPPGAHDADVGLTGYVPGWEARGHRGYSGYAWYRLRLIISAPTLERLQLSGPPAVDSAYQVFLNGQLLGSAGRFGGQTPVVFSIQPRIFLIPPQLRNESDLLIAFRVWMGPWDLPDPDGGGIHIAPAIGEAGTIEARYQMQWLQTIRGYIAEVVEAAAFVLLAVMAGLLAAIEKLRSAYTWLCAALVLTALYRANQAVFFWGQSESVHVYELISIVLLVPFCLAAWTLAWRDWFRIDSTWVSPVVGTLTLLYVLVQCLRASWFYGASPTSMDLAYGFAATGIRFSFIILTTLIWFRSIRERRPQLWIALSATLLVSVGQFGQEISMLGIPSIWFPFGTGVSRTQFAYAAFDVVLFALLCYRYSWFARMAQRRVLAELSPQCDRHSELTQEAPGTGCF